ncbi:MAG TPA: hypothetical protein VMS98_17745 [Thermoanaerobaculia bacterium]|nr:hypothetical protein [Thermoanaerobaculia bacterium]
MTGLARAAVFIALTLAPVPSLAQSAADDAAPMQIYERLLSLTDEVLVQLALAKGLDPVKAEALRDVYQAHRASWRQRMREAAAGRLTDQELRRAAIRSRRETDDAVRKLLTPAEIAWLDDGEARFRVALIWERLYPDDPAFDPQTPEPPRR